MIVREQKLHIELITRINYATGNKLIPCYGETDSQLIESMQKFGKQNGSDLNYRFLQRKRRFVVVVAVRVRALSIWARGFIKEDKIKLRK